MTSFSTTPRSRAAAVLEVVGVLVAAIVLGRWARSALGVASWKATQAEMLANAERDFWLLARLASIEQILKYGFVLLLFYAIGRWHRERRLNKYGFRIGDRGIGRLIAVGVVTWAALGLLPQALQALAQRFPALGSGPDHWALFPATWSLGFLVYMAASSFLLVPIVEELFARGYMVTRFAEEYGRGGALILSALFFTLAHTQYFKVEVLSLGMMASLLLASLGLGYVFLRTGSLVPVIVAHALANLPTPPQPNARLVILGVMLVVLIPARRALFAWIGDALSVLARSRWRATALGALLLGSCLASVALAGPNLPWLAAALLGTSLFSHLLDRRKTVARDSTRPSA